ncbi:MAG: type II toxin-antitoxin system RelE/ParE family toxin [Acidobacteria bacterium]|nr:type II toxin-antitoxin system RelE/ParE family toxin [Acidobacteriota bacterium]
MKPARFRSVAKAELREAVAWYRERDKTVARRFLAEVRTSVEFAESFPGAGAPVPGVDDAAIRRLPVHGFPYHVVFIELETRIAILAVAHDRRRPGHWRA